jgi:hypothetical protein
VKMTIHLKLGLVLDGIKFLFISDTKVKVFRYWRWLVVWSLDYGGLQEDILHLQQSFNFCYLQIHHEDDLVLCTSYNPYIGVGAYILTKISCNYLQIKPPEILPRLILNLRKEYNLNFKDQEGTGIGELELEVRLQSKRLMKWRQIHKHG